VTVRPPSSLRAAALALAALLATAAPAPAQQAGRELSLYVNVETGDNLVTGLTAGNFRLRENGEARDFRLEEPEPAAIALLVEHSRRSGLYYEDIQQAVAGFVDAAPEGHWYALATYAHETRVEVDFTRQKGQLLTAYRGLGQPMWNEIDTYDAIYALLQTMERMTARRRVLVIVGSGIDTFSSRSLRDVERMLERANVTVYVAGAGSSLRGIYDPYLSTSARMELMQAQAFLQMLADRSGGQAWFPRFQQAFPGILRGVMQNVEHQYRLVFTPRPDREGVSRFEVEAFRFVDDDRREDFRVRVRRLLRHR
jgi:Ca-activated chloride channel family protein